MREFFLPFHRPSLGDEEVQEVTKVLRSGWLTTGPKTKQFEEEFAGFVGASVAVAVNSATAALHLGLAAFGLQPGDEVIVPTTTFTASAEVVVYLGARPVLVDCRPDTFNLDERALEERITKKTKAVMPVHMAGQPCEMGPIMEISRAHGLKVIEDAAHALPARYHDQSVGTIGDITAFSFYATKTLTTGEGGMITFNSEEYSERIRMLSLHGISNDAWGRYTAEGSWYYEVLEAGFKYNMTDIAAAMGLVQLKKQAALLEDRRQIAEQYTRAFSDVEMVQTPVVLPDIDHAWHLYMILLNLEMLTIDRSQFIQELKQRNIGTSVHFIPLHLHPFYEKTFGYRKGDFPKAEGVYERCISLPIYPGMNSQDTADVIEAVRDVSQRYRR